MQAIHGSPTPLPSWSARWISPTEADATASNRPAHALSRCFDLPAAPIDAVLHITALGIYEAFLNGTRVGDHELAPGSTSYDKTLYAQSFPVGSLIRLGTNHLEVLLSDGWYRGRNGGQQHRNAWGDKTGLLAELHIRTDAGMQVVGTDDSWSSRPSHIVRADLMTGQTTDFAADLGPWDPVRVGVVTAPKPTRSPAPPVRRIRTLRPVHAHQTAPGTTLVDFGQNVSGWLRLSDLGGQGAITEITYGEHVDPDGDLTTAHLDIHTPEGDHIPCHQVDRVVAGVEPSVFEPRHTVHGFRYVRITHPGRTLDPSLVEAVVVHSDLRPSSSFQCSDDSINRLHAMASNTFLANAVDVPTDCPTRERAAWTGDFQVYAPLAATMFDISGFAAKWLTSLRDDQFEDGCLPMYAPDADRMAHHPDHPSRGGGGSAGWGDAAVAVPWEIYRHYGDARVFADNWDMMNRWVDFALQAARTHRHSSRQGATEAPHEQYIWDGTFHFGEWLEPRPTDADEVDIASAYRALLDADQGEVATAYLYRSLRQLSRIAAVLGHDARSVELGEIAEQVRLAWVREYVDPGSGRTRQDTQAAYVRGLAFDLIPPASRDAAVARLVELIDEADGHLSTGFLSTGMLLPTLADHGRADVAFALLQQTSPPSWLGMLRRGATTFWEKWEGVDAHGVVQAGSLNHYSKGAAMQFLYTHLLGLRQATGSSGWSSVVIRPHVGGGITSASGHLDTAAGRFDVAWNVDADWFSMSLVIPDGVQAVASLPDGAHLTLAPGRHDLQAQLPYKHDSPHTTRSRSR